jgi:hypothetical protein
VAARRARGAAASATATAAAATAAAAATTTKLAGTGAAPARGRAAGRATTASDPAASDPAASDPAASGIGLLREGALHAALKLALARPGDRFEVPVERFVIDLVRADGELVEIQTGGFGPLSGKLDALLDTHRMRIVHPVAAERRIVRVDAQGEVVSARRSPKRAGAVAIFDRLVTFPSLLAHPHLTIEVALTREDHIRGPEPVRVRRRTRDPGERRLVELLDRVVLASPADALAALPPLPAEPFTTRELARLAGCPTMLAQRVVYCLRLLELIEPAGKRGRAPLHQLTG